MNSEEKIEELKRMSKYIRTTALETILEAYNGHIGGNLSSVELLTALYFGGNFNFDPMDSKNENRDRVLIRGHEGPLRYTIFSLLGYIDHDELKTYRSLGSRLQGHEDMFETPGVDITPSGSLGMLLSYGVGSCISNKNKGIKARTVVFLGDGEEQEGNVSEAARNAASLGLDNLICILDQNQKQLSRPTDYSDGKSDVKKIWEGYGWDVLEIENGNDIEQVLNTYSKLSNIKKPTFVLAHTTKGLGVIGAEKHFSGYHTLSAAKDKKVVIDSYKKMKEELKTDGIDYTTTSKMAKQFVSKPQKSIKQNININDQIYNIKINKSGINMDDAKEQYILELKRRIEHIGNKEPFYFITPDLLRSDIVEEVGFNNFCHYIDTGIREQHAIAMSHGISVENPNARIYVCYGDAFVYRALDQINAATTGKSNIAIVGENSGIFQGQNGKTHQSVGQPSALMSIPELKFYEPADSIDLFNVLSKVFTENNGVSYIRTHRGTVNIERNNSDLNNTGAYYIHISDKEPKLVLISMGYMAENAVNAAKELEVEYNIPVNVINVVNPKDFINYAPDLIINNAPIITLYNGGPTVLSQQVANAILSNPDIPRPEFLYAHGFENGTSGAVSDLINYYNFDKEGIKTLSLKRLKNNGRCTNYSKK